MTGPQGLTTVEALLGRSEESLRRERVAHVQAFLEQRGLTFALVREVIARGESCRHVVITSSPVHGLANSKSDLDTITVTAGGDAGERMATQLFHAGQHLETIAYSEAEIEGALADLTRIAGLGVAERIATFAKWDAEHRLRKKYLERLVNGVSTDQRLLHVSWLPALAAIWVETSLNRAVRAAVFLSLAHRGARYRAMLGYAVDSVTWLMDAVLSKHGDVYSNQKWFALRWRRFVSSRTASESMAPPFTTLERARGLVNQALRDPTLQMGGDILGALRETFEALGAGRLRATLRLAPGASVVEFLPGAHLAFGPGNLGSAPLEQGLPPLPEEAGWSELAKLSPAESRSLARCLQVSAVELEAATAARESPSNGGAA